MKPYGMADAEAELRDALDRDDVAAITRLEKVVDDLDVRRPIPALHAAALWYAEVGLHIFPLTPGTKIPLKGSGGCFDATNDPDMVNKWWSGNPQANIGIATGHLVDVIDIDGPIGQRSRLDHWDMLEQLPCLGKVSTPRPGGMHIYVTAAPGRGNKAGLLPGVDYRGTGGYVVAPPSTNEQGRYLWISPLHLATTSGRGAA